MSRGFAALTKPSSARGLSHVTVRAELIEIVQYLLEPAAMFGLKGLASQRGLLSPFKVDRAPGMRPVREGRLQAGEGGRSGRCCEDIFPAHVGRELYT